jgi:adenylate kinase family enzyme
MKRVVVVGNSGSGKTTLAASLADRLGVPHLVLDSVFHQPGWTPLPEPEFQDRVRRRLDASPGGWVVCGNYRAVREIVWSAADTVVWLDLPRAVVMRRVAGRTGRRLLTRQELWNGNREEVRNVLSWDPGDSIVRWAWTHHGRYVEQYEHALADPRWQHLTFVRLTTPRAVEAWVAALPVPPPRPPRPAASPGDAPR